MTRGIDITHYYGTILAISKQIDFFKRRGAESMKYKFPPHTDEVFKILVIKDLKDQGLKIKRADRDVLNIKWEEVE